MNKSYILWLSVAFLLGYALSAKIANSFVGNIFKPL